MTQRVQENRPGPLRNPDEYLKALQALVNDFNKLVRAFNELADTPITFAEIVAKPSTLSGYGIIDAAPIHHTHDASDILNLPAGFSGVVAWSAITGKPYTVDGFGIIDASKVGHKHHWSDILDPPPLGSGPAGPPGVDGAPGPRGFTGAGGLPGLDGLPAEPMMIPGPAGKQGRDGKTTPPVIWFEQGPPLEPVMIPGSRGPAGAAGAAGAPGTGSSSHEGVLAFGSQQALEPMMIPGPRGLAAKAAPGTQAGVLSFGLTAPEPPFAMGIPGSDGLDGTGFNYVGDWNPALQYFPNDVVRYKGKLYLEFKISDPPGTTPVNPASNWILYLEDGKQGPPGVPHEVAPPLEPMMIPGPRGPAGSAGAGGFALLTTEVNLRAAPTCARSGKFQIAGAGMTPGKPVYIQQAAGPYTGKGTRADEAEMDNIEIKAYVLDATHIQAYWSSRTRIRGNFKFNYAVSA